MKEEYVVPTIEEIVFSYEDDIVTTSCPADYCVEVCVDGGCTSVN